MAKSAAENIKKIREIYELGRGLPPKSNNIFRVRIKADSDCPIKHVVPVLDVLDEVGDIDYRIVSSKESDVSAYESDAEK